jgi:GTPase SAR1 family protein
MKGILKNSNAAIEDKNILSSNVKDLLDIDLTLLGTYSSGKTTILKLLTQGYSEDMYNLPRVTGTEINRVIMEGLEIKVREMSWNLVKSWPSVYKESKVIVFVVDATDELSLCEAYVELVSILKNFNRPVALLFNKCDLVGDNTRSFYDVFRPGELRNNYPGLLILPYSAFIANDIALLKD